MNAAKPISLGSRPSYRVETSLTVLGLMIVAEMATATLAQAQAAAPSGDVCSGKERGRVIRADPANYRALLSTLQPSDTLLLAAGRYRPLVIAGLKGRPGRCITITGPAAGGRAVIAGEFGANTVEIVDSS